MVRLIIFILICVFFLGFIFFNLDNKSDISFGIRIYKDIPVFVTSFSSFVLGMLFSVPFVLSFGKKRKNSGQHDSSPASPSGIKKLFGKKAKTTQQGTNPVKDSTSSDPGEIKKEDSPYGID